MLFRCCKFGWYFAEVFRFYYISVFLTLVGKKFDLCDFDMILILFA